MNNPSVQWNTLDTKLRYTAISRAKSKHQITVLNDSDEVDEHDVNETDMNKVKNRRKRANRMKDELYMKRVQAMNIINKIVRGGNVSDEYCREHTFLTKQELFEHLKIPNGRVP